MENFLISDRSRMTDARPLALDDLSIPTWILGPSGVGKTAFVAQMVALGVPFRDSDRWGRRANSKWMLRPNHPELGNIYAQPFMVGVADNVLEVVSKWRDMQPGPSQVVYMDADKPFKVATSILKFGQSLLERHADYDVYRAFRDRITAAVSQKTFGIDKFRDYSDLYIQNCADPRTFKVGWYSAEKETDDRYFCFLRDFAEGGASLGPLGTLHARMLNSKQPKGTRRDYPFLTVRSTGGIAEVQWVMTMDGKVSKTVSSNFNRTGVVHAPLSLPKTKQPELFMALMTWIGDVVEGYHPSDAKTDR